MEIKINRKYNYYMSANRYSVVDDNGVTIADNLTKNQALSYFSKDTVCSHQPKIPSVSLTITPHLVDGSIVGYWYNLIGLEIDFISVVDNCKFDFKVTDESQYNRIYQGVKRLHFHIIRRKLSMEQTSNTIYRNGEILQNFSK